MLKGLPCSIAKLSYSRGSGCAQLILLHYVVWEHLNNTGKLLLDVTVPDVR